MKIDPEEYSTVSKKDRIAYISRKSITLLIAVLVGLGFALFYLIFGAYSVVDGTNKIINSINLDGILISSAYASDVVSTVSADSSALLKQVIVGGCFTFISIFFGWCLFAISTSDKPDTISFSLESIKTLTGFYIGALTGFLGA